MAPRLMGFIGLRVVRACVLLATCPSALRVAAQTPGGGVVVNNVSPWIDVTAYGAKCNGATDDTAAIQSALAYVNAAGYGRVFVPYTGNLCVVQGYSSQISGSIAPHTPSTGFATITVSTTPVPNWITAGAPLDIYGTTGGSGTLGYNGVFIVTATTSSTIVVSSSVTGTSTNGYVSGGLWTNAIVDIEGECTTRQNSASCSGFTTPAPAATDSPIYILSSVPCTTAISGTCPSGQNSNTISVKHLNFADGYTTSQTALGGIYALGVNGFEISDDNFQNFDAPSTEGVQAGAGITLDGGSKFSENGFVANNKFYNTVYPVTIRNKVDGTLFIMNHAVCVSGSAVITNSIAFDLGYLWTVATSASQTGGENTLFANQVENCTVGYIADGQNDDNVISKAEMDPGTISGTGNSIGFSVLNSENVWVDAQTLSYCTGIHVANSTSVHLTNPRLVGTSNASPLCNMNISSDGGSFASATDVVDSASQPTITISGFTNVSVAGTPAYSTDSVPTLAFQGASGGLVTLVPPSASFTGYNWNWPTSAGTSGQLLTSAGGVSAAMTWTSPSVTVNGQTCTLGLTCTVGAVGFFSQGSNNSSIGVGSANAIIVAEVNLPTVTSFSHMYVAFTTADSSNNYSWGLYTTGGSAICTVAAATITGTGLVSTAQAACTQTTPITSVTQGAYVVAFTGAATTAKISGTGSGPSPLSSASSTTTTTGGAMPSTIVVPTSGASDTVMTNLLFMLQ